jgi:hypothetical protein
MSKVYATGLYIQLPECAEGILSSRTLLGDKIYIQRKCNFTCRLLRAVVGLELKTGKEYTCAFFMYIYNINYIFFIYYKKNTFHILN